MFYHKENLRRLKLFKELEPYFKIDKVFYLMEPIRENDFKKQFKTAPFGASLNFLYKGEQND